MKSFLQLKKNLKCDFTNLKSVRMAVLGDTATQFLVQALRGTGFDFGFDLIIFEADFDQIERQVFDTASELYKFNPEVVIIFQSTHKLLNKFNKLEIEQYNTLADSQLKLIDNIYQALIRDLKTKIIFYNYPEVNDSVFGNFANKTDSSFLFQLRKLNYEVMQYASKHTDFYLCDISSIQNQVGKSTMFQPSIYINSEMVLSIDVLPYIASRNLELISALYGKFKKCLILDLDNTIWGGIIGDDGIENIEIGNLGIGKAFTEFQYWIKKLKNRGIILAVCSKNKESVAKEPFDKHPDMVLHIDDFAVFMANWENKVHNIRQIQNILNIGFDSMVFLDDNPSERNLVKENIPEIVVPDLPEDPADYLEYLYALNLFEIASISNEDTDRTKQYQIETLRTEIKKSFINEDEFLKSLKMVSLVLPFNKFNTPRVAQLTQRSNQFNLRTIRYTEKEIESISLSKEFYSFSFTLEDKFGDNGLICIVILREMDEINLFIDAWLMSCRVINRSVENFVLNIIGKFAREKGFTNLIGEFIKTGKNEMVKDHYLNLGFKQKDKLWILNVTDLKNKKCYINSKENGFEQN